MSYIRAWLTEIDRQLVRMRCATPMFRRFDTTARCLTPATIRWSSDAEAIQELESRLRRARYPDTYLYGLERVWTRAELGELITEATNRGRQIAAGDPQREKGPALDPRFIPDDRLDLLIQRHRDMGVVEALRVERERRAQRAAA